MLRLLALLTLALAMPVRAQDALYRFVPGQEPAWASPENPSAARGAGGIENKGAKGHAFDTIAAGGTVRSDDNPEAFKRRLTEYREKTAPLSNYYASTGKLQTVDGMADVDKVTAQIAGILENA